MVKLTGPMNSTAASGTLAGILTFNDARRSHVLRKKPTPKQPRSGLQVSIRAMMQFVTQQWQANYPVYKATWDNADIHTDLNRYHKYVRYNIRRWREADPPSYRFPWWDALNTATAVTLTGTGGPRHVKLDAQITGTKKQNWTGLLFARKTAAPGYNVERLVHVFHLEDYNVHTWTHTPLDPGWWYYDLHVSTLYGKLDLSVVDYALCQAT